jgi:hypothetical protein
MATASMSGDRSTVDMSVVSCTPACARRARFSEASLLSHTATSWQLSSALKLRAMFGPQYP